MKFGKYFYRYTIFLIVGILANILAIVAGIAFGIWLFIIYIIGAVRFLIYSLEDFSFRFNGITITWFVCLDVVMPIINFILAVKH